MGTGKESDGGFQPGAAELLGKVNAQKERAADQKQIEEQKKSSTDEEYKLQEQMKSNRKKVEKEYTINSKNQDYRRYKSRLLRNVRNEKKYLVRLQL